METWWDALPESVRERVDGLVLRDDRLRAIRVTMEAVQALEEIPTPLHGLYDCQRAVMARYQELAGRIDRASAPPRDVETLTTRIRRLPGAPGRAGGPGVVGDRGVHAAG